MRVESSVPCSSGFLGPEEHAHQNLKEINYMIYIGQCTCLLSSIDMELHLWSGYSAKIYAFLCLWPRSLEDQITTFTVISDIPGLVCDQ